MRTSIRSFSVAFTFSSSKVCEEENRFVRRRDANHYLCGRANFSALAGTLLTMVPAIRFPFRSAVSAQY
jgi:hypothetical protein